MPTWNIFTKKVNRMEGSEECKPAPVLHDDDWKYEELTPGKSDVIKSSGRTQLPHHDHKVVRPERLHKNDGQRGSTRPRGTMNTKESPTRSKHPVDTTSKRAAKKQEDDITQWWQDSFITYMPECKYDSKPSQQRERRSGTKVSKSKTISTMTNSKSTPTRRNAEMNGLVRSARSQMASLLYTARNRAMLTETIERSIRMRSQHQSSSNNPFVAEAVSQADRRLATTYEARRLESDIQIDRENFLQDYVRENRLTSSLYHCQDAKGRDLVYAMPINCSSPIRCCTRFHSTFSKQEVQIYREAQQMLLSHSFMGQHLGSIYETMDSAMAARRSKSVKLAACKKRQNGNGDGSLSVKDWLEIDRPLVARLNELNEHLKKTSVPLRVVFRKTQETELNFDYDFWFVFPNTLDEIRGGFRYWEGVEHITTLDDYYSTNRGRY